MQHSMDMPQCLFSFLNCKRYRDLMSFQMTLSIVNKCCFANEFSFLTNNSGFPIIRTNFMAPSSPNYQGVNVFFAM